GVVHDVEEGLEQTAVGRREDRGDGDQTVGPGDRVELRRQGGRGEPGDEVVGDVPRVFSQLHDVRLHRDVSGDGCGQPVREQSGGGRRGEAGRHDGQVVYGHGDLESVFSSVASRCAAFNDSWVGASGTPGARIAANSLRSTGTISPSMSSCSSTVFRGSPAWSMRNSCRW